MTTVTKNDLPDIVIRSEEEAYEWLERASKGDVAPYGTIKFEEWATFNLYLKGEKFERSLTPTVMKSLIEFQRGIYHAYASAKFGNPSKRLSDEEKDDLEVTVKVNPGSSDLDIDYTTVATKLVEQMAGKMTGSEILIAVVSIAVLWFGRSAWNSYLESRKEIKLAEIADEGQRATLEALNFSSEQETARARIIAELSNRDERIGEIARIAANTHTEVVRAISTASAARIEGTNIDPQLAEYLTSNPRRVSSDARLDGQYRLLKLDWSDPDAFKVKVFNVITGLHVDAVVQDDTLSGRYKDALREAEWSRAPVNLKITARAIGDNTYKDAVIIHAEPDISSPSAT